MRLIIAEKPSVAKAIAPVVGAKSRKDGYFEGNGYIVSWCYGHLVGLFAPDEYRDDWSLKEVTFELLPMLPDAWKFHITEGCKEQFGVLKKLMQDSSVTEIICATDADREGECIFRYVYNLVGCRKPVMRLWTSSLEESAIRDGLSRMKAASVYDSLFQAGFARAKADWLVGMNASSLFKLRYHGTVHIVQMADLYCIYRQRSAKYPAPSGAVPYPASLSAEKSAAEMLEALLVPFVLHDPSYTTHPI